MKFISSNQAPAPGGHYSQAVEAGGLVFVSGMLPAGNNQPPLTFEAQVHSVLDHCSAVLAEAGCCLQDVVQSTVYLAGVEHWPAFNQLDLNQETVVQCWHWHHGSCRAVAAEALGIQLVKGRPMFHTR